MDVSLHGPSKHDLALIDVTSRIKNPFSAYESSGVPDLSYKGGVGGVKPKCQSCSKFRAETSLRTGMCYFWLQNLYVFVMLMDRSQNRPVCTYMYISVHVIPQETSSM